MIEVIHTPEIGDHSEISKPLQPFWADYVEKIFIELMVKEIEIGFGLDNEGFFKRIGDKLFERTFLCFSYSQLKDKFNQLRLRYRYYCEVLKNRGLTNNVTTTDAGGKSFAEVLRRSRESVCPMFNELECIFGEYDKTYYQSPNDSLDEGVDVESDCNNRAFVDNQRISQVKAKRSIERAEITSAKKLKDSTENVRGNSESGGFSITNCVKILESIEGVDSDTYVRAIKMFKDADWREMFMAMSEPRRLDWLASLK